MMGQDSDSDITTLRHVAHAWAITAYMPAGTDLNLIFTLIVLDLFLLRLLLISFFCWIFTCHSSLVT